MSLDLLQRLQEMGTVFSGLVNNFTVIEALFVESELLTAANVKGSR